VASMDPTIGIGLGSYNCKASVLLNGEPRMLRSREESAEQGVGFPSFVEFDPSGEPLRVGLAAQRTVAIHPDLVVWGVKRLIGRSYHEVRRAGDHKRFQYRIVEGPDRACQIVVGNHPYTPTEVLSLIFAKIKQDAEAAFNPIGAPVRRCVITIPAYFTPSQRTETAKAAEMAGFDNILLLPEPTAAALAYLPYLSRQTRHIMVIDFGATSLDVTVGPLYTDDTGIPRLRIHGHGTDISLGGVDLDQAILDWVTRRHRLRRVTRDPEGKARLRAEVERAKIRLSQGHIAHIGFAYPRGTVDVTIERSDIEMAIGPWLERCRRPIRTALREAGLTPADITHLLLVGGPTHMPSFRALVAQEFRTNPRVLMQLRALNTDGFPVAPLEVVARGAVYGAPKPVTPYGYGVTVDGVYSELIPRCSRYPYENTRHWERHAGDRSLRIGLIRRQLDPLSHQELHIELGSYQFDYRPEPGTTRIEITARYARTGALDVVISQPASGITMQLREVNRLVGRQVLPSTAHMGAPPSWLSLCPCRAAQASVAPALSDSALTASADHGPARVGAWSREAYTTALGAAHELLRITQTQLTEQRLGDRKSSTALLEKPLEHLTQAITDWSDDLNTTTPRVANLVREICHQLLVTGLLSRQQADTLLRSVDTL